MWTIEFYETENGKMPVDDFLRTLDKQMLAKTLWCIDLLAMHGNDVREPYSKPLKNGIFELRIQASGDTGRVLYFFWAGKNIVLTNGFIKKTQKTPLNEIEKAMTYKSDYELRLKRK